MVGNSSVKAHPLSGWTRVIVSQNRVSLEVFRKGRGTSVLMLPSLGRSARDFEDLGNRLVTAGCQVVLINPRGIGGSEGAMARATLHDLAKDVWMVVDHFGYEKAFILGQCFGSSIARTAASAHSNRVAGLILLAVDGKNTSTSDDQAEFQKVFDSELSPQRHLQAVNHALFARGNNATPWKDGWHGKTARLQEEAAKRTKDLDKLYMGGKAPALVLQGLDDRITPPQNAWDLASLRPNTRLAAFPNMGHAMLPEQPEAVACAIVDFINSLVQEDYNASQ